MEVLMLECVKEKFNLKKNKKARKVELFDSERKNIKK